MPKWKPGAREFTVSVNFHEVRGYQAVIPRPVAEHLGKPERITYTLRKARVEIRAASR
jgi:hypothetical protein